VNSKYIPIIGMLYISLILCPSLLGYKLVQAPYGSVLSAASLISPFWFLLVDVIAEVYGYQFSVKIFISAVICEILVAAICYGGIYLPSPVTWHNQAAFDLILGNLPRIFFFQILGVSLSWIVNIYILTRWKFIWRGRYFWLRSLGASGIAEILFTLISVPLTLLGKMSVKNVLSIVILSIFLKLIILVIFSGPANILTYILKKNEKIDVYDNMGKFNPFSNEETCNKVPPQ
jgi:uncharacterized integral membrane protein (TIGR00697 family)